MLKNPMLQALKDKVDKLHSLLSDPEEGLFTWNMAVGNLWEEIVEMWKPTEGFKGTKWVPPKEGSTIEDLLDALDASRSRVILNQDKLENCFNLLLQKA